MDRQRKHRWMVGVIAVALPFARLAPAAAAEVDRIQDAAVSVEGPLGDGVVYPGYPATLSVELMIVGGPATGMSVSVATSDPDLSLHAPTSADLPDVNLGEEAWNWSDSATFTLDVVEDATCDRAADLTIHAQADQGSWSLPASIQIDCATPVFSIGDVTLRDPDTGDPIDAVVAGSSATLTVPVTNDGAGAATNVTGHLSSASPDVEITDADANYGTLDALGGTATGSYALAVHTCDDVVVHVGFDVTSDESSRGFDVTIPARCPGVHLALDGVTADDAAGGDGDGLIEPGESVTLTLTIRNDGRDPVTGIIANLTLQDIEVTSHDVAFPDIAGGASSSSVFDAVVSANAATWPVGPLEGGQCTIVGPGAPRADDVVVTPNDGSSTDGGTIEPDPSSSDEGSIDAPPPTDDVPPAQDPIDPIDEPPTGDFVDSSDQLPHVVPLNGALSLTSDQGPVTITLESQTSCVLAVFNVAGAGGDAFDSSVPLAKTGALRLDVVGFGLVLMLLGALLRRRAAQASARHPLQVWTSIMSPICSVRWALYWSYLARKRATI